MSINTAVCLFVCLSVCFLSVYHKFLHKFVHKCQRNLLVNATSTKASLAPVIDQLLNTNNWSGAQHA